MAQAPPDVSHQLFRPTGDVCAWGERGSRGRGRVQKLKAATRSAALLLSREHRLTASTPMSPLSARRLSCVHCSTQANWMGS